jgi:septal ring factor EnvC (AmiA/AmiB activator)
VNGIEDAGRSGAGRDLLQITVVALPVLLGLVLAFMLGQFTAKAPSPGMTASGPAESSPDPQALIAEGQQADELRRLQKEVTDLKKELSELKTDKKDLEGKLSIAADTVNKLNIQLREAQRRTEEAEWKASQNASATAPTGGSLP